MKRPALPGVSRQARTARRRVISRWSIGVMQVGPWRAACVSMPRSEDLGTLTGAARPVTSLFRPLHGLHAQRRLCRRESGDRHTERRAAHVVHPNAVAEHHALWIAAVFAADAHLQMLAVL